jgi:hypothetical protein
LPSNVLAISFGFGALTHKQIARIILNSRSCPDEFENVVKHVYKIICCILNKAVIVMKKIVYFVLCTPA